MRVVFLSAVMGGCLAALQSVVAQPLYPEPVADTKPVVQSTADRFADIPGITLDTPAFASKKLDFTTDQELVTYIQRRIAPYATVTWKSLGKTPGGRDIQCLVITLDGKGDPIGVASNRRPNVWIMGQQHGNEPAGAEAALEIARRLVSTDLKQVLEKVNVIIVPRANPDGAAAAKRETSKGDMNRDHVLISLLETQHLRRAMEAYPPSVLVDAHEFAPTGKWLERFGVSQASDVLVQGSNIPGLPDSMRKTMRELFDPALQAAWISHGVHSFVYHTFTEQGKHAIAQMGSNYAGIARNAFALYGAMSYLIESRGVGLNKDHYQRRVASLVIGMSSILKTSAKHSDELRTVLKDSRKALAQGSEWWVDYVAKRETRVLPMYDPQTGEDKPLLLDFYNTVAAIPTVQRGIPMGYILPANHPVTAKLLALGVNVHRLVAPAELELETYVVKESKPEVNELGVVERAIATDIKRYKRTVEAGTAWVPITVQQQPLWRIAMITLEPESAGSYVSQKLLGELTVGTELPIHRVLSVIHSHSVIAPAMN